MSTTPAGDPHYDTWRGEHYSFQGLGLYNLATVPRFGFVAHSLLCKWGVSGTSNAAVAFTFGERVYELFGLDLYIDGVLQSRANGLTTFPDGASIERAPANVELIVGAVVVNVEIHFNDPTATKTTLGYWQDVIIAAPIANTSARSLGGLCAATEPFPVEETYPRVNATDSLFDLNSSRYVQVLKLCGVDTPEPPSCSAPGTDGCCPAFDDELGGAESLCEFAKCDGVNHARCLYDCCVSGAADCVNSYVNATSCSPPPSPPSPPSLSPPATPPPALTTAPPPSPPPPRLTCDTDSSSPTYDPTCTVGAPTGPSLVPAPPPPSPSPPPSSPPSPPSKASEPLTCQSVGTPPVPRPPRLCTVLLLVARAAAESAFPTPFPFSRSQATRTTTRGAASASPSRASASTTSRPSPPPASSSTRSSARGASPARPTRPSPSRSARTPLSCLASTSGSTARRTTARSG
jgi:hypothetical protein